jgi:nicotinamidase-related amidase
MPVRKWEGELKVSPMHTSENPLLNRDDSLLVIIDMQERLLPVMAEKEWIIENTITLIKSCRIMGLPVLFTEQQNLGPTIPKIREELTDAPPISKLDFDCFCNDAFAERLSQVNRNTLIIAGVEAHICVAQTALHALSGYKVHVVSDAISSRSPHNRDVALRRMQQCGVTITTMEMVVFELLGKAGTETFREVLKLVK